MAFIVFVCICKPNLIDDSVLQKHIEVDTIQM